MTVFKLLWIAWVFVMACWAAIEWDRFHRRAAGIPPGRVRMRTLLRILQSVYGRRVGYAAFAGTAGMIVWAVWSAGLRGPWVYVLGGTQIGILLVSTVGMVQDRRWWRVVRGEERRIIGKYVPVGDPDPADRGDTVAERPPGD